MAVMVPNDFLTDDVANQIMVGMRDLADHAPGGSIRPWYHDMPIWLYVGPGYPDRWQVLQASVLMDKGVAVVEISARTERVLDRHLVVPRRLKYVMRVLLEKVSVDFAGAAIEVWESEARDPQEPWFEGDEFSSDQFDFEHFVPVHLSKDFKDTRPQAAGPAAGATLPLR